jgi:TPP-dependent pyruvate/acetoin dehydrogenase alpha subunit
LDQIRIQVDAEIEQAVQTAMAAPDPDPQAALDGVFA